MNFNKVYCEECRKNVVAKIDKVKLVGTIKGEEYTYFGEIACCSECGNEVYIPEINDFNLEMLYNEYREKNDIVTLDVIRKIPEKYAIGRRPLSLLLGWGEQTYGRYYDGDVPSKQYSEIIKKIYGDPSFYLQILENNKDNLKSNLSYEKSLKAVNAILGLEDKGPESKINLVIGYLLNQCEDITPLALQKALYYVQGFYYAFYKEFIFSQDCEAWVHGPVYREIYERYQNYHFNIINKTEDFDVSIFSTMEKSVLDSVIKNICCYSGKVLERFTHNESPWLITRGELSTPALSNRVIEKKHIADYFCAIKNKFNMINPSDIEAYTQSMFRNI